MCCPCDVHGIFIVYFDRYFNSFGTFVLSLSLFAVFFKLKTQWENRCTHVSPRRCVHFAFEIMNECSILIYHYGACFESKLFVFDFFFSVLF